ncbi:hypothetical protein CC207_17440 [Pseudomonas sp. DrBHI1]|nr:hypothetical protein AXZ07_19840 [Pseudomonas mosselii]ODB38021.1 hypothetical protein A9L43_20300 [Pseudomonas mosselii]OWQ34854.1 hypothetical protein CC207_17440 [Pseudomonas sp. DrBHI1]
MVWLIVIGPWRTLPGMGRSLMNAGSVWEPWPSRKMQLPHLGLHFSWHLADRVMGAAWADKITSVSGFNLGEIRPQ